MDKKFDFTQEQVLKTNQAHAEFHHAYGCTMAQWGGIERALYYWFFYITQLTDDMARAIFYSARSFSARADMLQAAIDHSTKLDGGQSDFIKRALKRALGYSGFRNRMAHGEPIMNIVERMGQPREINYSIVQGKTSKVIPDAEISIEDLATAATNFHALQLIIIDAHPTLDTKHHKSPSECLRQLNALPIQANSKNSP